MNFKKEVSTFWHGNSFSDLELLCIKSFLYYGYEYYIYSYEDSIKNIPSEANLVDASSIIDEEELFFYQNGFNSGSVSGFSNMFRYNLLNQKGGIWVDTDLCLLSEDLGFNSTNVFVKELDFKDKFASCLIKSKRKNHILRKCVQEFEKFNKEKMKHGETGPELVTDVIKNSNLRSMDVEIKESYNYFPFTWNEIENVFYDNIDIKDEWKTIHFWNAWLTDKGIDKNGSYPSSSLYEKLKNKFLN